MYDVCLVVSHNVSLIQDFPFQVGSQSITTSCAFISVKVGVSFLLDPCLFERELSKDNATSVVYEAYRDGSTMAAQFAEHHLIPFGAHIENPGCYSRPDEILQHSHSFGKLGECSEWLRIFEELGPHGKLHNHTLCELTAPSGAQSMEGAFAAIREHSKLNARTVRVYLLLLEGRLSAILVRPPTYFHLDSHARMLNKIMCSSLVTGMWYDGDVTMDGIIGASCGGPRKIGACALIVDMMI